ncbi:hypothetical protein ACFZAV_42875 [Streptomyces sp. NPDC008343]|uniref:hypothetical protein n=1 Tax=Streptomyces sp. NPDC008343 TaxID=3364828 RepID=UPI0036E723FD
MIRRTAVPALLLTAGLALAGCSGDGSKDDDAGGKKTTDPAAAALAVAKEYQQAANALDWRRACELSTAALRRGSVDECAARNVGPATATPSAPASESPTATVSPPTYADGSTPDALPSKTAATGPDRASTGPVTASGRPVNVPAAGDHPAGYGFLLTYTVTWPDDTSTSRKAVRVVEEGGAWRVDQREDVQDGDMGHGDPVTAALSGG